MRTISRFLELWLAIAWLAAGSANGASYYVAPSGNDATGNGTLASPWKTPGHAVKTVAGGHGHEIVLQAGTYAIIEVLYLNAKTGFRGAGAGKTILISTMAGSLNGEEPAVLRLWSQSASVPGQARLAPVWEDGSQQVSHLTLDGQAKQGYMGVSVQGRDNVRLHHLEVKNFKDWGVRVLSRNNGYDVSQEPPRYLTGIEIDRCDFRDNGSHYPSGDLATSSINYGGLRDARIHHNTIHESKGWGLYSQGWLRGVHIHDNSITVGEIGGRGWEIGIAVEMNFSYDDCEVYGNRTNGWFSFTRGGKGAGRRSIRAFGNVMEATKHPTGQEAFEASVPDLEIDGNYIAGFGSCFASFAGGEGQSLVDNVLIHHNVCRSDFTDGGTTHETSGLAIQGQREAVHARWRLYNNVFDGLRNGFDLLGIGPIRDFTFENNIFTRCRYIFKTTYDPSRVTGTVVAHNLFHGHSSTTTFWAPEGGGAAETLWRDNLDQVDPGLSRSGVLPDDWRKHYYPASATSPVVDAGVAITNPLTAKVEVYHGLASDIGAREWGSDGSENPVASAPDRTPGRMTTARNIRRSGTSKLRWAGRGTPCFRSPAHGKDADLRGREL